MQYFTIGDLVTALALAVAFTQLLKPIILFRLRTGRFNEKFLFVTMLICIVLVFLAALWDLFDWHIFSSTTDNYSRIVFQILFPPSANNFTTDTDYYVRTTLQILVGFLIVTLGAFVLQKNFTHAKINKSNYRAYFLGCRQIITYCVKTDLYALADEIYYSLDHMALILTQIHMIRSFSNTDFFCNTNGKPLREANKILASIGLWTDDAFLTAIVCHSAHTAHKIFKSIFVNPTVTKNIIALDNNSGKILKTFANLVLRRMFIERDSILYRETDGKGLGIEKGIKYLIFENVNFVTSNYRPLQLFDFYPSENITDWQIEKYSEALLIALKAYLKNGNRHDASVFYPPLEKIADIVSSNLMWNTYDDTEQFNTTKIYDPSSRCLHKCLSILASIISFIGGYCPKNQREILKLFPEDNDVLGEDTADKTSISIKTQMLSDKPSIYDILAIGLYDVIEAFSRCRRGQKLLCTVLKDLYLEDTKDKLTKSKIAISKRLHLLFMGKVRENLHIERPYYPAVTASLIYAFGLVEPEKIKAEDYRRELIIGIMLLLKKNFKQIYARNKNLALDMLPKNTRYDEEKNQLIRIIEYGRHMNREEILTLE